MPFIARLAAPPVLPSARPPRFQKSSAEKGSGAANRGRVRAVRCDGQEFRSPYARGIRKPDTPGLTSPSGGRV